LNLADEIKAEMPVDDFMEALFSYIINNYDDAYQDSLTEAENRAIHELVDVKYRNPQWNIGYSPDYQYTDSWSSDAGTISISLSTKEGHIDSISIQGPEKIQSMLREIERLLQGTMHDKNSTKQQLKKINFASEKEKGLLNQILDHIF
jgi:lipoate-protein ligase A